jgi:hypothetical protein
MRRLLLVGRLFVPLLVPLLAPATAAAGTCPALDGGVVERDAYRVGQQVEFYGTYGDFANPGTVSITLERSSDATTRQLTAFNLPDGEWEYFLTFEAADVGTWSVTVVVDDNGAIDTCTDRFAVRRRSALPNTDAAPAAGAPTDTHPGLLLAIAGLAGFLVVALRRPAREMRR